MTIPQMGIYGIEGPNGCLYIGSAINIAARWCVHKRDLKAGKHHSMHLQHAWNKYGEQAFQFKALEEVHQRCDLIQREQAWLDDLFASKGRRHIYNISPTAGSCLGVKHGPHSQERREKIATALRGRKLDPEHAEKARNASRGKKLGAQSEERRQKISQALTGRKLSEEHRQKAIRASRGVKHTEETRRKLSDAQRGHVVSAETRQKISVANTGRRANEETRRRLSEAHKGKKPTTDATRKAVESRRKNGRKPMAEWARNSAALRKSNGKQYTIIAPDGTRYAGIINVSAFVQLHGLNGSLLRMVLRGERSHHKGWTGFVQPRDELP